MRLLLLMLAVLLTACAPAPAPAPKVASDPVAEEWYGPVTAQLAAIVVWMVWLLSLLGNATAFGLPSVALAPWQS